MAEPACGLPVVTSVLVPSLTNTEKLAAVAVPPLSLTTFLITTRVPFWIEFV